MTNRQIAQRSVRIALLVLVVPAVYNFIYFNYDLVGNRVELPIHGGYRIINSIGLVLVVVATWFFGLTTLELLTSVTHLFVARKSTLDDWKTSLYTILRRMPIFAVAGAVLWAIWVFAFYQLQLGFYTVSVPIGIASHLLAACLYVPLIHRWYSMERSAAT